MKKLIKLGRFTRKFVNGSKAFPSKVKKTVDESVTAFKAGYNSVGQ